MARGARTSSNPKLAAKVAANSKGPQFNTTSAPQAGKTVAQILAPMETTERGTQAQAVKVAKK